MQRMLFIMAALALLLAACAPAKPTVDPANIQASAVAAASTMIAQTQAAIPSNTPPPPTPIATDTPAQSPTPFTLPTLPNVTATRASSGGGDCNALFDVGASGPTTNLLIRNNTKGPVTVSMGINTKNTFGQCGYLSWANIPRMNSITVSLPLVHTNMGDSCYWAYAWINDPKNTGTVSGGGYCIDNTQKWTLDVYYDKFRLTPP